MNQLTSRGFQIKAATTGLLVLVSTLVLMIGSQPLFSAQTANVDATVTVQNISVSVTDGAVAYGTLSTSAVEDTTNSGIDDSQTATNNGNIAEDLNIRGLDTGDWTLAATQGSDNYFHKFCTTTCDSSPTWTALTTSYQQLADGVGTSGNQIFDLQVGAPSSTSSFVEQTATVTVQAVAD